MEMAISLLTECATAHYCCPANYRKMLWLKTTVHIVSDHVCELGIWELLNLDGSGPVLGRVWAALTWRVTSKGAQSHTW